MNHIDLHGFINIFSVIPVIIYYISIVLTIIIIIVTLLTISSLIITISVISSILTIEYINKLYYYLRKIDDKILQKYKCGISHEIMSDPVITECGQIYDRKNIERWLLNHDTDPLTNTLLKHKNVCTALHIRREIKERVWI